MQNTVLNKTELLEILRDNRSKHRRVFEAAVEGYRAEAIRLLEAHIKRIKDGKLKTVYVSMPAPEDHTRDYDRVIHMVEMHQGDTFSLTEQDFGQLVLDDWSWKRAWITTSSTYAASTVKAEYGDDDGED